MELMQTQVEPEVNDTDITYQNLVTCMTVAWKIESGGKEVTQVGQHKFALVDMEFKRKCHLCGMYKHKQNKYPKKNTHED